MQAISEQNLIHDKGNNKVISRKTPIGKVVVGLSAIAVFSKVFGFAEKLIVAHFFGTAAQADVYFASMGVILSIVFLVRELIYPSLLPVFAETLSVSFLASSSLFRKIFLWTLLVLTFLAAGMALFSDTFARILVPGFSEDKRQLTSAMLRFLAPGCLFLSFSTLTYSVLNCRKNFFKAALPEAGLKFFTAAGLIMLAPVIGIYALAAVVTIGAAVVFFVQFLFIPESKTLFVLSSYKSNNEFCKVLKLMGPLVIGVFFSHISGLVDNMLASTLPTGHLSYLGYSKKLIDAILLVGPVALVTVVYPQLSHLALEETLDEFKGLFVKSFRLILYVSLPAAIVLVVLREPFVQVLFERGKFISQSTLGTSQALFAYGIGFVTFSLEALIVYSFYALSNTKVPVRAGIFGVCLDIILAVVFVKPFGFMAIAWAFVISKTIKMILLLVVIERKLNFLLRRELLNFLARLIGASLVSAFILQILAGIQTSHSFFNAIIFNLAVPALGFVLVFAVCSYLLKIDEFRQLLAILLKRKNFRYQLIGKKA